MMRNTLLYTLAVLSEGQASFRSTHSRHFSTRSILFSNVATSQITLNLLNNHIIKGNFPVQVALQYLYLQLSLYSLSATNIVIIWFTINLDYVKQRPLKETTAHLVHMLYKLIQLLYLHVYVTVWEINHWVFHEHTKGNEEAGLISRFNRPHVFTGWWISNFSGFYLRQTIHIRVWIWNKKWKQIYEYML